MSSHTLLRRCFARQFAAVAMFSLIWMLVKTSDSFILFRFNSIQFNKCLILLKYWLHGFKVKFTFFAFRISEKHHWVNQSKRSHSFDTSTKLLNKFTDSGDSDFNRQILRSKLHLIHRLLSKTVFHQKIFDYFCSVRTLIASAETPQE